MGFVQNFLEYRMCIIRFLAAVLNFYVFINHSTFERPGTIQGSCSDDVAEVVRLHTLKQIADTTTFQLEDTFCFSAA